MFFLRTPVQTSTSESSSCSFHLFLPPRPEDCISTSILDLIEGGAFSFPRARFHFLPGLEEGRSLLREFGVLEPKLGKVGGLVDDRLTGTLTRFYNGGSETEGSMISRDDGMVGSGRLRGAEVSSAWGKDGREKARTGCNRGAVSKTIVC